MIDSSMPLLDDFDATTYIRALITVVKMDGIKPIERQYVEARAALLGVETGALWDEDLTDLPPIPDDVSLVTRRVVVRDCILMACIDDDYTDRERERVHQIAAWLSVDVDHSPEMPLDPASADFYTVEGQQRVAQHLAPGGVMGVWSAHDNPPFAAVMAEAYPESRRQYVEWDVPSEHQTLHNVLFFGRLAL